MSTVTAAVVAHVDRTEWATELVATLGRWYPTTFSLDDGRLGCTGNHLRTWRKLAETQPQTPWTMVIEDDAVPIPAFGPCLDSVLRHAPAPIVSLYLGTGRPAHAQSAIVRAVATDLPFIVGSRLLHCVAVCVRTSLIGELIAGAERAAHEADKPIDEAITEWMRSRCLPVAYTNPSLVDHADQGALATHQWGNDGNPRRVAHHTGTRWNWSPEFAIL